MKLARSLVLLGLSTALSASEVSATDFYVKAVTPGPVSGTPLAIITLQSGETTEDPTLLTTKDDRKAERSVRLKTGKEATVTERAGKWVSAPGKAKRGRSEGTSGGALAGGETSTSGDSAAIVSGEGTTTGTAGTTGTTGGTETAPSTGTETGTSAGTETTTSASTETGTTTPTTTPTTGTTTGTTTGSTTSPTTPTTAPTAPTSPTNTSGVTYQSFNILMQSGKVAGGDRIFLMDGYHGPLTIRDQNFSAPVVIAPAAGSVAHADSILISNSRNIYVQGLKVWARSSSAGSGALVRSYSNTSDIAFTDLDVRAVATSGNYMQWTMTDWTNNQRIGFQVDGNRTTIARNRVTGIYHGIFSLAPNALVEENIVDGFSGDGMRALGDNSIVRRNKVQNCYQINANHADAFQSFSRGAGGKPGTGTVRNLTIEDNKFFEWTQQTSTPLRCKLQGIGMFDGMYDGVTIRNNVISSTAYHGISLAGPLNTVISNNTVIHANGVAGNYPWIRISGHKNGTPPKNVMVANNMVTSLKVNVNTANNISVANNIIVTNASNEFNSVTNRDFTLKSTSKGVDAGAPAHAPSKDIAGALRPKGKAPDAGAYENF